MTFVSLQSETFLHSVVLVVLLWMTVRRLLLLEGRYGLNNFPKEQ
jgi:hypothetical protein